MMQLRWGAVALVVVAVGCGGAIMRDHQRNGRVMFVASTTDDRIQTFKVGGGALDPLKQKVEDDDGDPSNDQEVTVGIKNTFFPSLGIAVSPQDRLYSATANGVIEQFRIRRSGELEYLNPSTANLPSALGGIAVSPNGKWLYATASPNKVYQYTIATSGTLAPHATPTVDAGITPVDIDITPNGQFAYVVNHADNTISQFSIEASGALQPLVPANVATPAGPRTATLSPDGSHYYVACADASKIAIYTVGGDGKLAHVSDVDSALNAESVAVQNVGGMAFSASVQGPNEIRRYSVSGTGALVEQTPPRSSFHANQVRIAFSPEGFLYVSDQDDDRVTVYRVLADGTLSSQNTEGTVDDPGALAFRYLP